MAPRKSSDPSSDRLRELLRHLGVPRDDLPYTDQFDSLKAQFESDSGESLSPEAFWRRLSIAGKRGGGSETGRRRGSPPPELTRAEQLELLRLFPDGIGNRDQLPYTKRFENVYRHFNQLTRRKLTKHEFWRALSSLAKCSRKPRPLFDTAPLGGLSEDFVRALDETQSLVDGTYFTAPGRYRRWAFSGMPPQARF